MIHMNDSVLDHLFAVEVNLNSRYYCVVMTERLQEYKKEIKP